MRTMLYGFMILGVLAGATNRLAADDRDELRKQALALNEFLLLGDDEQQAKTLDDKVQDLKKDPVHAKKLLAAAAELAGKKEPHFTYAASLVLGSLAKELNDVENGQLFFGECIEKANKVQSGRKVATVSLELLGMLTEHGKYADAEKACKQFLSTYSDDDFVNRRKMYCLRLLIRVVAMQGRTDEAFKLMDTQLQAFGSRVEIQRTHAWLLQFDGQYEKAAKIYEQILDSLKGDDEKAILHLDLGNLYSDSGDVDKATTHLQWVLKRQPDEPRYNNALGYTWADAGRDLDEAEKLIRKALAKEPATPAFLDSLGWVLHKKGKFTEAKELFLKAIREPEGRHAEIYDHLGETHKALGEKDDAVSAWKKALEVVGPSKREQQRKAEIEKKLRDQ